MIGYYLKFARSTRVGSIMFGKKCFQFSNKKKTEKNSEKMILPAFQMPIYHDVLLSQDVVPKSY